MVFEMCYKVKSHDFSKKIFFLCLTFFWGLTKSHPHSLSPPDCYAAVHTSLFFLLNWHNMNSHRLCSNFKCSFCNMANSVWQWYLVKYCPLSRKTCCSVYTLPAITLYTLFWATMLRHTVIPNTVLPSVPMRVCEQKFPVILCSHVSAPFIYHHKLWWKNSGATSGFVCCFQAIMNWHKHKFCGTHKP